jgi:hypothetical protein
MISVKSIEKAGRKAWLAGLGSFVFGKEYATNKIDKAYVETTQLVTNLMSVGEKLEKENEHKFPDVDQRILQIREKLGLDNSQPNQLVELEARVSHLTDVVNKLVEAKAAENEEVAEAKTPKPRASRAKAAPKAETAETKAAPKAPTTRRRAPAKKTATAAKSSPAKRATTKTTKTTKAADKPE